MGCILPVLGDEVNGSVNETTESTEAEHCPHAPRNEAELEKAFDGIDSAVHSCLMLGEQVRGRFLGVCK